METARSRLSPIYFLQFMKLKGPHYTLAVFKSVKIVATVWDAC